MPFKLCNKCHEQWDTDDYLNCPHCAFNKKTEALKRRAPSGQAEFALLSGNRPGVDEYLPGNDSRADLFKFDEQGALSFPCCSCTWKSEDQMKCVKCRHFAI